MLICNVFIFIFILLCPCSAYCPFPTARYLRRWRFPPVHTSVGGPFACPRLPVPVCSSRNHDCTWHTAHSSTSTRPLAFVLALGGLLHFRVPCPSAQYAGRGFAMNSPGVSQRHPCQELGRVHHSNGCHQGPAVCRPTEIKEPFSAETYYISVEATAKGLIAYRSLES